MLYYKRKILKDETDMKPRIFVSSTFYDLKYIREDLSNFIREHDFEPVMFEDGDIGYTPGKALDSSCYEALKNSDMVILVIGGQYGSAASGEISYEFEEYISVTRNEFKTAIDEGIPIYAFIDSKVYSEYTIYEMNLRAIEDREMDIKFSATKNINVFRFIKEIKNIGSIVITEFIKVNQIKEFLGKQWADMFKRYLNSLKTQEAGKKIESTIDEMKVLIGKMDIMLETVGKKILTEENNQEFDAVIKKQEIAFMAYRITSSFNFEEISEDDKECDRKKFISNFLKVLNESFGAGIWESYVKKGETDILEFSRFFSRRKIYLGYVSLKFMNDHESYSTIMRNSRDVELLVQELIKDSNYRKMIYKYEKE